ncbi:unnamed protein product [Rotaria socialis]|uniref:VCBS repeat-containing protein n=2 Tax=Rotaria socialis TaxID=392032 RepID=A0A820ZTD8_9BILA|nr:unnamed protein product [Rotaria socialis]
MKNYICIRLGNDKSYPIHVAVGDINNDNKVDIVTANTSANNIGVFMGFGYRIFSSMTPYTTGNQSLPIYVVLANFNHDPYLDVVVASTSSDTVGIFLGYGDGTFANITTYSTGISSQTQVIAISDFNNGNRSDIVVANYGSNGIRIFVGHENKIFLKYQSCSTGYGSRPRSAAVRYFNHNDWIDLAAANSGYDNVDIIVQTC